MNQGTRKNQDGKEERVNKPETRSTRNKREAKHELESNKLDTASAVEIFQDEGEELVHCSGRSTPVSVFASQRIVDFGSRSRSGSVNRGRELNDSQRESQQVCGTEGGENTRGDYQNLEMNHLLQLLMQIREENKEMNRTINEKLDNNKIEMSDIINKTRVELKKEFIENCNRIEYNVQELSNRLEAVKEDVNIKFNKLTKELKESKAENSETNRKIEEINIRIDEQNEKHESSIRNIREGFENRLKSVSEEYTYIENKIDQVQGLNKEQFGNVQSDLHNLNSIINGKIMQINENIQFVSENNEKLRKEINENVKFLKDSIDEIQEKIHDIEAGERNKRQKIKNDKKSLASEIENTHCGAEAPNLSDSIRLLTSTLIRQNKAGHQEICTFRNSQVDIPTDFIKTLNTQYQLWGNSIMLHEFIRMHLKETALIWFNMVENEINSIEMFNEMFLNKFWKKFYDIMVLDELNHGSYFSNTHLSPQEYFSRVVMRARATQAGVEEEYLCQTLARHFGTKVEDIAVYQGIRTVDALFSVINRIGKFRILEEQAIFQKLKLEDVKSKGQIQGRKQFFKQPQHYQSQWQSKPQWHQDKSNSPKKVTQDNFKNSNFQQERYPNWKKSQHGNNQINSIGVEREPRFGQSSRYYYRSNHQRGEVRDRKEIEQEGLGKQRQLQQDTLIYGNSGEQNDRSR